MRVVLILTFLALVPFSLLFVRDFVYADDTSEEIPGCVPYDLQTESDRFSTTITWKTTQQCAGYVEYDLTSKSTDGEKVYSPDGILPVSEHSVTINDLKPSTKYYIWVFSNGEPYGNDGMPVEVRL